MGYVLDDIVKEYLIEIGDNQMNRYARFYQFGVAGLREFHNDMTGVPKTVLLDINSNDTVDLPSDFVNYVRIGICGADGIIYALGRNDNIDLNKQYNDCGVQVKPNYQQTGFVGNVAVVANPGEFNANWRNGELEGRFFGIGGGNNANGYFRMNRNDNTLVLSGLSCEVHSIVLEYLADIEVAGADFPVHQFIIETLKAWIYWKSIQRDRNVAGNIKSQAQDDYIKARRVARKRLESVPLSEWYEAIRSQNKMAPKF